MKQSRVAGGRTMPVMLTVLLHAAVAAAEPTSPSIAVSECRVKLIDRVVLASDRTGVLADLPVEEGDRVTAGQTVASLRDEVARAAFKAAQRQAENDVGVRFATKRAEIADLEHKKALAVNKNLRDAIPDLEVRRLKAAAEQAVLEIEQARHELELNRVERERAEAVLRTHHVVAPFDGWVVRVHKREGEAVTEGGPILEIVSVGRLRVEGYLPLAKALQIEPGDAVEVSAPSLPASAGSWIGRIVFVDPSVQPVSGEVRVWAEVDNPQRTLRAGLLTQMRIDLDSRESQTDSPQGES